MKGKEGYLKRDIKINQNGVTMIALVVTVIVLLILSGIGVSYLTGDSAVANKATTSEILTELSQLQESVQRYKENSESFRIKSGNFSGEISNDDLKEKEIIKVIETEERELGIITDFTKFDVNVKLGKDGIKYKTETWNNGETLTNLYNVYAIDMQDNTLYYIKNNNIWTTAGAIGVEDIKDKNQDGNQGSGDVQTKLEINVNPLTIDNLEANKKVTISINNTTQKELSSLNKYQYYLSTKSNALVGGEWTEYESGKEITLNPTQNTNYYLMVKMIQTESGIKSTSKNTVSISGEKYHVFGPYTNNDENANYYSITYYLNGGTVEGNPTTYKEDTETFTLKNPTRDGYVFIGWTGSCGDEPKEEVTIEKGTTGAKRFDANWVKDRIYTINYDGNGATGGTTASSKHRWGEDKKLTKNGYARTDYRFLGWSRTKTGTVDFKDEEEIKNLTLTTDGEVTLYAVWQDATPPRITIAGPSKNIIANGESTTYTITTNKNTTLDKSKITISGNGASGATVAITPENGTSYTVTITAGNATGEIT